MPGKVKTNIICARNLPIMDRSSDSSDAFVEIRFGSNNYDKTSVYRKSLDPEWNCRFVFEVEEDEIQEEPLQIRVLDHDTYSSHDAIGKVYIDLKPLLNINGPTSINGFIPIFDTLHGIRGEIKIQTKIEIFNDCNEYRKSSCGVQFFCSSKIPEGYTLRNFCGFVEELVFNDDPEYQWIDKIRTPRTSNEARQKLFTKLSGEVQRRIGLKVLEMDGNCVLGYQQYFDLEGEYGIVVRGIGTAANIYKVNNNQGTTITTMTSNNLNNTATQSNRFLINNKTTPLEILTNTNSNNNNNSAVSKIKLSPNRIISRIHSDSDLNSYYHHQNIVQYHHQNAYSQATQNDLMNKQILEKLEYPFLTIQQYPFGFVKSLCGLVCSRSVKLLGETNDDDSESRNKWWLEIRNEIRSHMKSLNCHIVLGYSETKSNCEDVCVLSATGTAAIVDELFFINTNLVSTFSNSTSENANLFFHKNNNTTCKICHVPYSENDLPFPVNLSNCCICGHGLVPEIIFSSIQPLPEIDIIGKGCSLRAIVARPRKKSSGEMSAKIISDYLPFMEYEIHRQLVGKLKLKGMNMLYGFKTQISIGENLLVGIAEATACYAAALPSPVLPMILSEKNHKTKNDLREIEQLKTILIEEINRNKEFFDLDSTSNKKTPTNSNNSTMISFPYYEIENQHSHESKSLFKIELEDFREKDNLSLLFDTGVKLKKGFYTCNTEFMPGINHFNTNFQMFTSVYRCETSLVQMNTKKFNEIFDEIIENLKYKFRNFENCCLANLSFDTSLYDDDHAMIIINGTCLTFNNDSKTSETSETRISNKYNVEITNLSFVPNYKIDNYLGLINLFLIRESTQIKENGGLSGFMHCFISEVLALSRAHVLSLGGNALVSFKMNECILLDNPHRNQGQCLINVSGDAVKLVKANNS